MFKSTLRKTMVRGAGFALISLALSAGAAKAQGVPAPAIEILGNGSYTVTYPHCDICYADGLEELSAATGTWEYAGTGTTTFTDRAPGTYRYRVVYTAIFGNSLVFSQYGPEASVVVAGELEPEVPSEPGFIEQFNVQYSVSSGDIDGDGRRDLIIRDDASASSGGTIGNLLLRQTGAGALEASLPDQYQLAVSAGWVPAAVELRKRDVNVDGYVDLVLRGLSSADGFGTVLSQIVFAPGVAGSGAAATLRPVDARLEKFSADINRHLLDPDYYPNHVPLSYAVLAYYYLQCSWAWEYGDLESWYYSPCFYEPYFYFIVYQDFSAFDPDAMAIASADYGMIHGSESIEHGMKQIAEAIARILGIEIGGLDMKKLLGGTAGMESDDATLEGIELFGAIAGISEAVAQEVGEGEGSGEPSIPDRVLLKGRRVLGQGPFHTALEYRYSTVSAYDSNSSPLFDGTLVSEVNWPPDHPSLTLRLGYVDGPAAAPIYWSNIRAADARYGDDLPYDLFPSLGQGGYNSNSFVSGLILATLGQPTVEMTTFVGGERPVPASEFN